MRYAWHFVEKVKNKEITFHFVCRKPNKTQQLNKIQLHPKTLYISFIVFKFKSISKRQTATKLGATLDPLKLYMDSTIQILSLCLSLSFRCYV